MLVGQGRVLVHLARRRRRRAGGSRRAPSRRRRWPAACALRASASRRSALDGSTCVSSVPWTIRIGWRTRGTSFAGSVLRRLWNSGVVDLTADVGRKRLESLAGHRCLVDALLEIDPRLLVGLGQVRSAQHVLLLREHEIRPADAGRRDQDDGGHALLPVAPTSATRGRPRCGRRPRCASRRRLSAPSGTSWRRADRLSSRRAPADFRPSAALADAALVVAEHDEPCVGHGAGQLAQGRNAEREAVAIAPARSRRRSRRRAAAPARPPPASTACPRARTRSTGIRTRSSFGREMTTCLRRHRRDVVAGDVDVLGRHGQPQQPAVLVAPDVQVQRQIRRARS